MRIAERLQHAAGHGLIGMLLHVLGGRSRLPTTEPFSLIIPCRDKMWGLAAGFSEAKLESSIADQLTSFPQLSRRLSQHFSIILPEVAG
jgi:hypothetical protein